MELTLLKYLPQMALYLSCPPKVIEIETYLISGTGVEESVTLNSSTFSLIYTAAASPSLKINIYIHPLSYKYLITSFLKIKNIKSVESVSLSKWVSKFNASGPNSLSIDLAECTPGDGKRLCGGSVGSGRWEMGVVKESPLDHDSVIHSIFPSDGSLYALITDAFSSCVAICYREHTSEYPHREM